MQEYLPFRRAIGKKRSSDGNAMGTGSKHKVEESTSGSTKTGVEIKTDNFMGGMSRGKH